MWVVLTTLLLGVLFAAVFIVEACVLGDEPPSCGGSPQQDPRTPAMANHETAAERQEATASPKRVT